VPVGLCALAACSGVDAVDTEPTAVGFTSSAVTGSWNSPALRSDFMVHNAVWAENGMKAIPPHRNGSCWDAYVLSSWK
jgi:hypothetical protein